MGMGLAGRLSLPGWCNAVSRGKPMQNPGSLKVTTEIENHVAPVDF
jgi:hypothetical protein